MVRTRMGVLALAAVVATSGCAWVGRVGVSTTGQQPSGGFSAGSDLSPDGRYMVFTSDATNLVANDLNNAADVFLRDNQTGSTERVSISSAGVEGGFGGYGGLVSSDGRYVAFTSDSDNLVTGDTNFSTDVFLRDRTAGTTIRVSLKNLGGQSDDSSYLESITPDGKIVVFSSDAESLIGTTDQNYSTDVYLRDMTTATFKTQRVSVSSIQEEGDLDSYGGSISDDGRYVAFVSDASNFSDDDSGAFTDVFVRDRTAKTTIRVTEFANGDEADYDSTRVLLSGDGKVVAFDSDAENLLDPVIDGNLDSDVYTSVVGSKVFERTSVALDGGDSDDYSFVAGISDNGRFVLFQSGAHNLAGFPLTAVSNSFVRDRVAGTTALAGVTPRMTEPANPDPQLAGSVPAAISGDGRYVLFSSTAADVVDPDTNGVVPDVYQASNPVPLILSVTPNVIARGATVTLTMGGINLHPGGGVMLMGDGITVNSITPVSETQFNVSVTVAANAPVGARMPILFQIGTGAGALTGGLAFLPSAFSVT